MASGANSLQELANAAYCEFTYLDQPHLARVQEFFITADIKDYEKRKTFFERHFHFLCPKLEWELSFPNRQVQLEIEAIVRESVNMETQIQPPGPKRPWDVYHTDKVIGKDERVFKIAQSMVAQYMRGGFEYSKRLREIVSHSNQDWIDLKCATVLSYCIFADRGRDDVPDEEHRALARLHTTLKDGISFTESTSPYGPSSLPSGSPSVNGENENEHNQSEEILNFRPANQRPNIHHVETSSLISRLSAFLPTLAAANVELASGIPEESRFELDSNSEQVGEHIEMDLGLGVLEQITPSATESAIRESSTISLTNKRKATDNDIGEGRIPMSLKSTEKKDDLAPGTSSPKKIKLTISGSVSTDSNSNSSGSGKKNKHASGKPSKNKKKTKKLSKVLAESSNRSSDSQPPPKPKRTLIFIPSGNKKFTMQIDEKVIGLLTDLSIQKADLGFEPFPKYAEPSQKECDAINEDIKEKVANNELVGFKVSA